MGAETQADQGSKEATGQSLEAALEAAGAEFLSGSDGEAEPKEADGGAELEEEAEDLTEGDEPEEDEAESDGDDEAEADEQNEGEEQEGSAPKTRAEKRREKIASELRPAIRAEVEAELAPQIEAYRKAAEQQSQQNAEMTKEHREAHLLVDFAGRRLDLYEQALSGVKGPTGRPLLDELRPQLEVLATKLELERHKQASGLVEELAKARAQAQQSQKQIQSKLNIAKLEAMAEGAGVDPDELKIRLFMALKKGQPAKPADLLAKLKAEKAPRPRRKPRTILGGGNSDGAPDFPKLTLESSTEDLTKAVEAQIELDARKRGAA